MRCSERENLHVDGRANEHGHDRLDERRRIGERDGRRGLDWNALSRHTGYHWEHIAHLKGPGGPEVYAIRLSQQIRAIGYRDGDLLRLVSLHPDHDSAYER